MPKKILALCGSPRSVSTNAALLRATARLAPADIRVELFGGLGQLPLFNPELEAMMPAPVRALHEQVISSDALLIRVAIFNASPRSVHADARLREILTTMSAGLDADACLALPLRGTGITGQGILDSSHAADIRRALALLVSGARA